MKLKLIINQSFQIWWHKSLKKHENIWWNISKSVPKRTNKVVNIEYFYLISNFPSRKNAK